MTYNKNEITLLNLTYIYPFGIIFELLKIPQSFLANPQYWWLLALQIDSNTSYISIIIFGYLFNWRIKEKERGKNCNACKWVGKENVSVDARLFCKHKSASAGEIPPEKAKYCLFYKIKK